MEMSDEGRALWETAQALARARPPVSGRPAVLPMLFFTDPDRTPRPWEAAARLPAGSGVVYRHFGADDARQVAERLRAATRAAGAALLIGADAQLAEAVGADGLHLPERDLAHAVRLRRPGWVVTGAVHTFEAARAARGLDGLVLSPIFPAGGASARRAALGLEVLRAAAELSTPIIALGGVDARSAPRLIGTGAAGLAAVGAIQGAFAPADA